MPLSSPDVSDLLQPIVKMPLWQTGSKVNILIGANSSFGLRDFEGPFGRGPELVVFYLPATSGVDSSLLLEFSIVIDPMDLQVEPVPVPGLYGILPELEPGLYADQDITQLVVEAGYLVALRFSNIDVPQGASILDSHLELDALIGHDEFTSVAISAEAADDGPVFAPLNGSYLVHRERVEPVVFWSNLRSTTLSVGEPLESPDLTSVIAAVTTRPGWAAGGHINIIINVTAGMRVFHHAGAERGPALQVRYADASPPPQSPSPPRPPPFPPPFPPP